MESKKYRRLVLGLAILFSLFLFQASEDHHHNSSSCDECMLEEDMGVLTITNNGNKPILVFLKGTIAETGNIVRYKTVLNPHLSRALLLEPGFYHFIYFVIINDLCILNNHYPKNIVKSVVITAGVRSNLTFTFTNNYTYTDIQHAYSDGGVAPCSQIDYERIRW